ncbi:hypothetical protein ED733_000472 [Metarhizium rileyi]|uniref:Uncharacterized protein n=1 Tax=Metarhizium rileyi (strain RCEF 4871) TaxID=1649241 RepID=A0A5C6G3S2_METRR|nr:hypothetical protein ED733_000472 [Metarhizium rileyi]
MSDDQAELEEFCTSARPHRAAAQAHAVADFLALPPQLGIKNLHQAKFLFGLTPRPPFESHTFRANSLAAVRKLTLSSSGLHNTKSAGGGYTMDPQGWHLTMAFKDKEQEEREFHVASHGYTRGKDDFVLVNATHDKEKMDSTARGDKGSGKVVWPNEAELVE